MDENTMIVIDNYKFSVGEAKLFRKMLVQLAILYRSRKAMDADFKEFIRTNISFSTADDDANNQYIDKFLRKRVNFKFDDNLFKPLDNKLSMDNGVAESVTQVADLLITWNARIDGLYITNGSIATICDYYHVDRFRFKTYLETPNSVKEGLVKVMTRN